MNHSTTTWQSLPAALIAAAGLLGFSPSALAQHYEYEKLLAPNGGAVDLDGSTAISGAYMKSDNGQNTGAAYMFNDVHFQLGVAPDPPRAGTNATFTVTNGNPLTRTYLGYSLQGLRQTYVGPLNVTIELRNATQTGGIRTTDTSGSASWTLSIPGGAVGRSLWIQAVQFEKKTNVVATQIQP